VLNQDWINIIFPEVTAIDDTAALETGMIDRLARLVDMDRLDVAIGVAGILRVHGYEVPPFELRTNTWRIDLPAAVVRAVLGGIVAATIIEASGAPTLPTALLSLVAPLLFRIERVEIEADDITICAELQAAVRDQPRHLEALYQELPTRSRSELSITEFAQIVERLLDARLASVGPDGIRLAAPGRNGGFRLALASASLVPNLLKITALSKEQATAGPADGQERAEGITTVGPQLADGQPRVFISYAQESEGHKRNVLAFAEILHRSNVGVIVDQDTPPYRADWQVWATQHITKSDYVLVIASPMCRQVGDGTIDPELHKGLQAEMRTLRELYNSNYQYWLRHILPVILPGMSVEDIPLFLQPHNADHYRIISLDEIGTEDMMRTLTAP
jgi:hypothetical protein